MAVATKAAAFVAFARFLLEAAGPALNDWQPAVAALAVASIVVGNVGALGQDSLKRLLGYSGVAQAGYMLAGILVATEAGLSRSALLPRDLRRHEPGGVRRDRHPRARDQPRRFDRRGRGPRGASRRGLPGH